MARISSKTLKSLSSPSREIMEDAFKKIYDEYAYLLYYLSLKIVRNAETAKEIVNESFLIFFEHKEEVSKIKNLKSYLTSICHNLSINALYKESRFQGYNEDIAESNDVYSCDQFASYMEKFKDFLDEEEVDLIVFHLLYDYSFKEIASYKKVSLNVITGKYRRAIEKIRKHY